MTPLALRDLVLRGRHVRALLLTATLLLALVTAVHHSGLVDSEMGSMDGHAMGMPMCVGIAVTPIAVEGLVLINRTRRRSTTARRRPRPRLLPASRVIPAAWAPSARAGPNLPLRLCVDRR